MSAGDEERKPSARREVCGGEGYDAMAEDTTRLTGAGGGRLRWGCRSLRIRSGGDRRRREKGGGVGVDKWAPYVRATSMPNQHAT